jgi:hypothetical protein
LWKAWTEDGDGQRLLGVNTWDGIAWFRKEGFALASACAALAFVFAPADTEAAYAVRLARAERTYETLREAEKKSGYRIDGMAEELVR